MSRRWFLFAVFVTISAAVARDESSMCYASYVKSMIKVRDEAELGPLPSSLTGAERIKELMKNGIPASQLIPGMVEGERVDLHVICKCLNTPKLPADGNYIAAQIGLHQAPCQGNLPFSSASYNVTDLNTCFAAAVRSSQRERGAISSFLLSTVAEGEGAGIASATKHGHKRGRIFRKGQFRLGAMGYMDVCNQDQDRAQGSELEATTEAPAKGRKSALKGANPLSAHVDDKEMTLLCANNARSVHQIASGLEFYY